jgi:hypothetical protein
VLGGDALVRQQLAPSRHCRSPLPERYRVVDDLAEPLAVVVAVAEREAAHSSDPARVRIRAHSRAY